MWILDLAIVIYALVTLLSDYCSVLSLGLPLKTLWKLHPQQEAAAMVQDNSIMSCCS